MLSAVSASLLDSKDDSCRFLEGFVMVLLGCVLADVVDGGLSALAAQCKTCLSFLLGTRCRVGGDSCLTLGVQMGCVPVDVVCGVAMGWGLSALLILCGDLTALARRCKFTFSCLPGTWCLVGEEVQLSLVVGGEGPGGTEGGDVGPIVAEAIVVCGVAVGWGWTASLVLCGDLTALARRRKFTFSCLPGTWCLVGEEVELTLVVRGEGPGGTGRGDVGPVMTEASVCGDLTVLSRRCKLNFVCLPGT